MDRANGFSFAASEVRDIIRDREERAKNPSAAADLEAEMRKKANNLFKMASNSEIGPSYHHTIEIMERYESSTIAESSFNTSIEADSIEAGENSAQSTEIGKVS